MRRILKQNGFTIIEVMIAVGIAGIVAMAGASIFETFSNAKARSAALNGLARYRYALMSSVKSSDTLLKTTLFNCMVDRTACTATSTTPYTAFAAIDPDLTKLTNPADPAFGFTREAKTCPSFPSKACPFRYETEWRLICSAAIPGSCLSPQFQIRARLKVAPDAGVALKTSAGAGPLGPYDFELTVGQIIGTYEQSCVSIGGIYVPGPPPTCLPSLAGSCPVTNPPSYMVGYDSIGKAPICAPLFNAALNGGICPSLFVMVGTDANGDPVCKLIKTPTTIPPTDPQMACATPPCPFDCQVNPNDPSCPQSIPVDNSGMMFGDGGCGMGGSC